ncbi:MAG: aldehyde dehydrogenase family protein [Steroidobacteraceae bacterium]
MLEFGHHFIAGQWQPAGGPELILLDPTTEERSALVRLGTREEACAAVSAAAEALPAWSNCSLIERASFLCKAAELIEGKADALADTFAREIGTPIAHGRRLHVEPALHLLRAAPLSATNHRRISSRLGRTLIERVPLGVAALITPWNYPLYLAASKLVPAMLAGCTVVLKPSELAPASIVLLAQALHDAGTPPGVFNVVLGDGVVGEALVSHRDVAVVSFTGSTAVGRRIGQVAGASLKKLFLELGGKSASLVLNDAPLEVAVEGTLRKSFQNSGQTCSALSRLLVPAEKFDQACALAAACANSLRVGNPLEPRTELGPLISAQQRNRALELMHRALAQGARCIAGGPERSPHLPRGYFVNPTVLATTDTTLEMAQTEAFAPIVTILPFKSEEEAVAIANGTNYGLSGAVWSAKGSKALRFARRMRAGSISINGARTHPDAPFGGFAQSGFGRERGPSAVDEFLTTRAFNR